MTGDSILALVKSQNLCHKINAWSWFSACLLTWCRFYILCACGALQWVMVSQYHINCKSPWGTSKWQMKSIQSIRTLTSQKLSVQANTIPHHILNFTFVQAVNACSASCNTALTDLFSPVRFFTEPWDIAGKAMCSTSFLPRVNFFRQMSFPFQEDLESNKNRRRKQMGRKKWAFSFVIHCGLVAYVVNWALSFSFKIFAYGWSLSMKGVEYSCWGVPLHCPLGSGGRPWQWGSVDSWTLQGLKLPQVH